jgi:chemotaxis protein CheX
MDVKFVNPFIMSIKHVFRTMVGVEVNVLKPQLKTVHVPNTDVSGIIGYSGEAVGCVVLRFPMQVACRVASAFASAEIDESHPDFGDAIGELTNMVAGCAKKEFEGMRVGISLPSVVVGKDHSVLQASSAVAVVIPCETQHGPVFVEVVVESRKNPVAARPAAAGAHS